MEYIPHTNEDIAAMLRELSLPSLAALFEGLPVFDFSRLPPPQSEQEIVEYFGEVARHNVPIVPFVGQGAYPHYIPAAVRAIVSRAEFYTSYTPYQPEVSQGILTAMFEFQTYITRLTGMDVANASMYCGASALAEAMLLAVREKRNKHVLLATPLFPDYYRVLSTYAWAYGVQIHEKPSPHTSYAALIVQNPDAEGTVRSIKTFRDDAERMDALLINVTSDATVLAIIPPPGEEGADIAVGDYQAFGNDVSYGGPHGGFFAAKEDFLKKMPGRIVGKTTDKDGREGYMLTLQAREQHIRREKATSNICSNHALTALAATVYLALMGPRGLRTVAEVSYARAHYLAKRLQELGCEIVTQPFYNECVLKGNDKLINVRNKLFSHGYMLGAPVYEGKDDWLVCATELHSYRMIDTLISRIEELR